VQYPLIASSKDGGNTWSYTLDSATATSVPADFNSGGSFNSVSCSGQTCVAAGSYSNGSSVQYPLIASSKDGGNTWSYTLDSVTATSVPANFNNGGNFNNVSCSGLACIAAGAYSNNAGVQYPLIASSKDGGNTWTYTLDNATATSVPADFNNSGNFNSASCGGQVCVAAGSYSNNTGVQVEYPLIASSQDGGNTWSYTLDSTTATSVPADFNPNSSSGQFNSASCTGLACIAAGSYSNGSSVQYPLIASSKDGGNTWTYTLNSANVPVDFLNQGTFTSTSTSSSMSSLLPDSLAFLNDQHNALEERLVIATKNNKKQF
ncbi:MAG: hypothetical protein ACHP65_05920, partial [Legionellales bacterium]